MNKFDIINESLISFHTQSITKEGAIREMTEMLVKDDRISNPDAFIKSVFEREAISSTDAGIGVAIPHGKGAFVAKTSVAICRFDNGLLWEKDKVKAVILLAVDDNKEGTVHLELIARVSTMLMDDDFMKILFNAADEKVLLKEIFKRLEEEEE